MIEPKDLDKEKAGISATKSIFDMNNPKKSTGYTCMYCDKPELAHLEFMAFKVRDQEYVNLMNRGFIRSCSSFYACKPSESCCQILNTRVDATKFKMSKKQRKIWKEWNRFLNGERGILKQSEEELARKKAQEGAMKKSKADGQPGVAKGFSKAVTKIVISQGFVDFLAKLKTIETSFVKSFVRFFIEEGILSETEAEDLDVQKLCNGVFKPDVKNCYIFSPSLKRIVYEIAQIKEEALYHHKAEKKTVGISQVENQDSGKNSRKRRKSLMGHRLKRIELKRMKKKLKATVVGLSDKVRAFCLAEIELFDDQWTAEIDKKMNLIFRNETICKTVSVAIQEEEEDKKTEKTEKENQRSGVNQSVEGPGNTEQEANSKDDQSDKNSLEQPAKPEKEKVPAEEKFMPENIRKVWEEIKATEEFRKGRTEDDLNSPFFPEWNIYEKKKRSLEIKYSKKPKGKKEHYDLFCRYEALIHDRETSFSIGVYDYAMTYACLENSTLQKINKKTEKIEAEQDLGSVYMEFYLDGTLIGIASQDHLSTGQVSGYFFFEPIFKHLNFGIVSSLYELQFIQESSKKFPQFKYYYLESYLHDLEKVNYKRHYKPFELLCPETRTWVLYNKEVKEKLDRRETLLADSRDAIDFDTEVSTDLLGYLAEVFSMVKIYGRADLYRIQVREEDSDSVFERRGYQYACLSDHPGIRARLWNLFGVQAKHLFRYLGNEICSNALFVI